MFKPSIDYHTHPSGPLHGQIQVPGDKSISHRALILSAIAQGRSTIQGLLMGEDNLATLAIIQALGVEAHCDDAGNCEIQGLGLHGLQAPQKPLDCGNSGTAMRLLAGLLAGQNFDTTLIGDASLSERPMERVVSPLQAMGASITMTPKGTPPLTIQARPSLTAVHYDMPIASAQIKSALLLAGLYAEGTTVITDPGVTRDHTERMLQGFGYEVQISGHQVSLTSGGQLTATHIIVPGDISSAAFFLVAASITPGTSLQILQVGINPTRLGVINLLNMMGANITLSNESVQAGEPVADITVAYSPLKGIEVPQDQVALAIDEFPVLMVAAACAQGRTILRHARELRVKETDRIDAVAQGLIALGVEVLVLEDGLIVEGGQISGGEVNSFGDHRIAMAFTVAGGIAKAPVVIKNCANVATSFPNFLQLANQVGMHVSVQQSIA